MFEKFETIISFIRKHYNQPEGTIPLHEPHFSVTDRQYVLDAIDSTYVSSVGRYVDQFESLLAAYTGAAHVVAVVNGTSALHIALMLADVKKNDLVITQPLSFIATCNAISYTGAEPVFVDVDPKTLGMSVAALCEFLNNETTVKNSTCVHKQSGRRIAACVPMHTFGHPVEIDTIAELCARHHIALIEDAAESIGSFYKNKHTGCFGLMGVFSFNGNKTITCGGGGAIVTNNRELALKAKHLTTQAKVPHRWAFIHDMIGYNYRLPNLNAALACSQLEQLPVFLENKRATAAAYKAFFDSIGVAFVEEPPFARSNYWLNAILFHNQEERDAFLEFSNDREIMTRPAWTLINKLPMYSHCLAGDLTNANDIESRLVNIPSSVKQS